ncbi:MAG: glycosyltransferase family 1 protein [Bryobacteraceae bacterium]
MARIGVNALYLIPGGVGGTEVYLRELLRALAQIDTANEYFVFGNLETQDDLVPRQSNFHWKQQAVHAKNRPARILWEQGVLPMEAARYKLDVLLNPGFTAPVIEMAANVTVFHDLQHKRHPEYFRWFDLPFWNFLLWASSHRAKRLIAVTEATRKDLQVFYGIREEHVNVVHHGVEPRMFALPRQKPEPFVLCVSTLHPHKNLDRLVRVYGRKKRDYQLVLAGMRGFHAEAIEQLVRDLNLTDQVTLTGWISREDLFGYYSRALACVQPSTFEGFGMPVLEAMAAGVPLACSNIPPHCEVVNDTAILFDPLDEDALEAALENVTSPGAAQSPLVAAARRRAREFTWERTARRTLDALLS